MFIPPSMLEGSKPEYRPEPFTSARPLISVESFTSIFDTTKTIESQVPGGREALVWSIREFRVKPESRFEVIGGLVFAAFGLLAIIGSLNGGNVSEIRRGLFAWPIFLAFAV
jgi:hypothetical protein